MVLFYPISDGNVCKSNSNVSMCLTPILVGFVYGGIICFTTPFKGLAPINEVKEVPSHKIVNTKNALNMTNSADPDETPHFATSHLCLRYLYE